MFYFHLIYNTEYYEYFSSYNSALIAADNDTADNTEYYKYFSSYNSVLITAENGTNIIHSVFENSELQTSIFLTKLRWKFY